MTKTWSSRCGTASTRRQRRSSRSRLDLHARQPALPAQQLQHPQHRGVHVHRSRAARRRAARSPAGRARSGRSAAPRAPTPSTISGAAPRRRSTESVADQRPERVADLVRDPGREAPEGGHLLRLHQLPLGLVAAAGWSRRATGRSRRGGSWFAQQLVGQPVQRRRERAPSRSAPGGRRGARSRRPRSPPPPCRLPASGRSTSRLYQVVARAPRRRARRARPAPPGERGERGRQPTTSCRSPTRPEGEEERGCGEEGEVEQQSRNGGSAGRCPGSLSACIPGRHRAGTVGSGFGGSSPSRPRQDTGPVPRERLLACSIIASLPDFMPDAVDDRADRLVELDVPFLGHPGDCRRNACLLIGFLMRPPLLEFRLRGAPRRTAAGGRPAPPRSSSASVISPGGSSQGRHRLRASRRGS